MKKIRLLASVIALVAGCIVSAQALPFYDLVDFSSLEGNLWFQAITDGTDFTYAHELDDLTPPGQTLNSATLTISHSGFLPASVWLFGSNWETYGEGVKLGDLNWREGPIDGWAETSFILTRDVLDLMTDTSTWTLAVRLHETTGGFPDALLLDKSELYGDYTPVPEPASMMLLGSGLLGIGGFFIRKKA